MSSSTHGYYRIAITPHDGHKLLRRNGERAFVISQLQDLLSPRLIIGDIPAYRQLSSCIDLLAFSIRPEAIELLVFSIDATIANDFTHRLIARLSQYQYEYRPNRYDVSSDTTMSIRMLEGPHSALAASISLHTLHDDWEFDRYSSIGFFLHDRRGDWMRLWRLTQLYDNEPETYRELIANTASSGKDFKFLSMPRSPLLAS